MSAIPKMVSVRTLSRMLDKDRKWILRACARGLWPGARKIGCHWRIPEKEVVEWLNGPPTKSER